MMREQGELQGSKGLSFTGLLLVAKFIAQLRDSQMELWPPVAPELQEEGKCFGAYMQLDTNIYQAHICFQTICRLLTLHVSNLMLCEIILSPVLALCRFWRVLRDSILECKLGSCRMRKMKLQIFSKMIRQSPSEILLLVC